MITYTLLDNVFFIYVLYKVILDKNHHNTPLVYHKRTINTFDAEVIWEYTGDCYRNRGTSKKLS